MTTNLSRDDARHRSATLALSTYDVELDLRECTDHDRPSYPTRTTLVLASREADTFLDFIGEGVDSVTVDGQEREIEYDGARVQVRGLRTCADPAAPDAPTSTVVVTGRARYSRSGEGLHRYLDPADGRTYLYTQYEPADARRVFADVEQPDLKARFTFHVSAPADWEVLSNQSEVGREDAGVNAAGMACARRTYAQTPPLSTYLTCVCAGPYRRWSDSWSREVSGPGDQGRRTLTIPLGALCRQSLADVFDAEEVLALTKRGLDYFHDEFDYPYPWGKYDSILVPEYNLGAMENPGLVTFTDARYVFQSGATRADHEMRANTIMHEMSHMWFGDLVTPQWWDDLWLKESFADYMGTAANVESGAYPDAWTAFAARRKAWAYRADQLPTTHPIVADIPDVEAASQNFDGITYAKGASVVRQLVAYVGRDAFYAGARAYFRAHDYRATTLSDLLTELEATSGRDLGEWVRLWLETTGLSTLSPRLELAEDGTIARLVVRQEPSVGSDGTATLRPHRLLVGLYRLAEAADGESPRLLRTDALELDVTGADTLVEAATGLPAPDLVVVNDDDWTYAKTRLDEASLACVEEHLSDIDSSLTRAGLWAALWNACRDALLPAERYVTAVLRHAAREDDLALVATALTNATTAARSFAPAGRREELTARIAQACWAQLAQDGDGPGRQLAWARAFAGAALTCDDHAGPVRALLDGDLEVPGLPLGPELRWQLWRGLAATGHADAADLARAREVDATSLAPVRQRQALAALPTPEAKREAYDAVLTDLSLTNDMVTALATGFATPGHGALTESYVDPYFAALEEIWSSRSMGLAERAIEGLFPGAGDARPGVAPEEHPVPAAAGAWLATHTGAPAALRRLIAEQRDDAVRALRAQAASGA